MKKNNKETTIFAARKFYEALAQGERPDASFLKEVAVLALNSLPSATVLGAPLFSAIWRQVVMATVEPVCLRDINYQTEVFLAERGVDESYPGRLHVCGTPIRSSDECNFNFVANRLAENEYKILAGDLQLSSSQPIEVKIIKEERGLVLSLAFSGKLRSEPADLVGKWYSWETVKCLKDDEIVPYQRDWLIPTVLKDWVGKRG